MQILSKQSAAIVFFSGIFFIFSVNLFTDASFDLVFAMILFLTVSVVFLLYPLYGLFLLLFVRPSIDLVAENFDIQIGEYATINAASAFGMLVISLALLFFVKHGNTLKSIPLKFPFLLFILVLAGSVVLSIDPFSSIREVLRILSIASMFFLAVAIAHQQKDFSTVLKVIILSSIIPVSVAIFQLVTGGGLGGTTGIEDRLFGTFAHPNSFASYLLLTITLLIYFFLDTKLTKREKILYGTYLVIVLAVFIGTFSRGGWLAFLFFIGIFGILRARTLLVVAVIASMVLFFVSETVRNRVEDVYNPPADSSILWRLEQWNGAILSFSQSPVYGFGAGTETIVHEDQFGFDSGNPYTHNDVLKLAVENGLLGAGTFLFLMFSVVVLLLKSYRRAKDTKTKLFVLIALFTFLAEFVFGMSSNIWRSTATQWGVWVLIGVAYAVTLPSSSAQSNTSVRKKK